MVCSLAEKAISEVPWKTKKVQQIWKERGQIILYINTFISLSYIMTNVHLKKNVYVFIKHYDKCPFVED